MTTTSKLPHKMAKVLSTLALDAIDKSQALAMLGAVLERMRLFEAAADRDRANRLKITREIAEKVENVSIFLCMAG